jgi:hypothetical protein
VNYELVGYEELREWLLEQGFRVIPEGIGDRHNECNWIAYRRSELPARECEGNPGKTMQLLVRPYQFAQGGSIWQSIEVDVTGQVNGLWWKLQAYSMSYDELRENLTSIEEKLISAWNALHGED